MTASPADDDLDPLMTTAEIIEEARRPLLIARHRPVIEEMEGSLGDGLVSGTADNPRLAAMLRELDEESEQRRIQASLRALADDERAQTLDLRQALIELLCLQRENHGVEVASLQLHAIGVYRRIRAMISDLQSLVPSLEDLRTLPVSRLGRLLNPIQPRFGSPTLAESLVIPPSQVAASMTTIKRISRARGGDTTWEVEDDAPALPRDVEEPLSRLPEAERQVARTRLQRDRARSRFYRRVFLVYFDRDTLSNEERDAHRTILHWLESIEQTPHLYPFMQGLTPGQKRWRLGCLARKILQLNEMYQRLELATQHPTYRDRFASLPSRERLVVLAKDHYPTLPITPEFTAATMLCPFKALAAWVQEKVAAKDFVLPPEPKGLVNP